MITATASVRRVEVVVESHAAGAMSLRTRLSDWVIPKTEASGCFGPGCTIIGYDSDTDRKAKDQFASAVQFLVLKIKIDDIVQNISVVVKFQSESEEMREMVQAKGQFKNENLMYSEILPLIDEAGIVDETFCKYYYGIADDKLEFEKDFVMLEDLGKQGYKLTSERIVLDYDHCALVMKQIGRFHALSYAVKKKRYSEFKAAVSKIEEKWTSKTINELKYMLYLCAERGILPLVKNNQSAEHLKNFLKNFDDPEKFYSSLVNPIEPEAVLCHGDFCRNNMLFSYGKDGKPNSVKFFDLQTPRYASPAIDLSFFLLMNTSKELRENHWDELLNIYNLSVKSTFPDIEVPNLDFSRFVYGYIHCSFFLPYMIADSEAIPVKELVKLTPYERGLAMAQVGGPNETQCLVEIVEFLLKKNYLRETY